MSFYHVYQLFGEILGFKRLSNLRLIAYRSEQDSLLLLLELERISTIWCDLENCEYSFVD
jgi:hypothetical protein